MKKKIIGLLMIMCIAASVTGCYEERYQFTIIQY